MPTRVGPPPRARRRTVHDARDASDDLAVTARNRRVLDPATPRLRSRVTTGAGPRPRGQLARVAWREFVRRHGWRAYALPLLAVVTVVALATMQTPGSSTPSRTAGSRGAAEPGGAGGSHAAAPTAPRSIALKSDPAGGSHKAALKDSALPPGPAYTTKGDGTFRVLTGTGPVVGSGTSYRYDIEVENGVTGIDLDQFTSMIQTTLADKRSWSGHGVSLQRVSSGRIDFHISLTSSLTVRRLCGYSIPVETSCYAPSQSVPGLTVNRVVLNDARWVRGATAYVADLHAYRIYMINHEDGHALGHEHAHQCLPGGLAPAMMQQTFGLTSASTGKQCQANPWPYPTGVSGAPGAEQPDTPQNDEYGMGD